MREVPFGKDGDFSKSVMINRMNSDLANDLGNLSQRVLSMIFKNCDGTMPALPDSPQSVDAELLASTDALLGLARGHMDTQAFHDALREIWQVISDANRYVDATAPWGLKKTDPERMAEVLAVLAETIRQVAILVQPVMPEAAGRILDQLAVTAEERDFTFVGGHVRLAAGRDIAKPEPVFPRYIVEDEGQGSA